MRDYLPLIQKDSVIHMHGLSVYVKEGLAELFNMCLKESCFPDNWKVSFVVPVFKNVEERSTAKNYHPVSPLSVVSKVFEKLVNNRIVDHLDKCGLF